MTGEPTAPPVSTEEPRRVSPLTPVINAWKVAAGLVGIFVWQGRDTFLQDQIPLKLLILIFLGVVVVAGIVSLIYNYIAWRFLRYGFDSESIYVHAGILFRSQRHVRLDRIQSVDLNRPLMARIFGYVALHVTSAGGAQDNLAIAFVKDDEGTRLRNEILARAAGLAPEEEQAATEAPEYPLFRLQPGRLIGSYLRSLWFLNAVVFVLATITLSIILRDFSIILAVAIPFLGVGTYWWNRLNQQYDFQIATSPDGIRLRYGLLSTVAKTVPPGRVQALEFTQPLLWRRKNWWQVSVLVAGTAVTTDGGEPMLYPVASQGEATHVLSLILPDLGHENPVEVFDHVLNGTGATPGFTTSPRKARWLDWITWKRNAYTITNTATLIRRGRITRRAIVVPHARIQSLGLSQGPWESKLGLYNVKIDTTPGAISPVSPHLDGPGADQFIRLASHHARIAREQAGPERWMESFAEETSDIVTSESHDDGESECQNSHNDQDD